MRKIDEMLQQLNEMKGEVRSLLNDNKVEEAEAKMQEVRNLEKKIELQKQLDEEEERNIENRKEVKTMKQTVDTNLEYRAISKYLLGKELTAEERASVNVGNAGAILPAGFVNQVQVLTAGYPSLKKYAHVIPVSTNSGKMPISAGAVTRELADLAVDTELVKEMITLTPVNYAVKDYGKLFPVENSVLEDAGIDFYNGVIAPEFAECAVNTENEKILALIAANATAFTGTDWKAIAKCLNTKIVPSLLANTIILTNQTGFDYLDNVEDNTGRPLLNASVADASVKMFKGRPVVVMDDTVLTPVTNGLKPFYVVNPYAMVKFFDRKNYEIAVSKEAGFTYNQTFVRVIERFDVQKADTRACYYIEF